MRQAHVEDQVSMTIDYDEIMDAFSEPDEPNPSTQRFRSLTSLGMIKIEEDKVEHDSVKNLFVPGMGPYASHTGVVAIHKILSSSSSATEARWNSFEIFSEAVAKRRGGDANVKFAWYAGSRDEISSIVSHGFSLSDKPANGAPYGASICLYPDRLPLFGAEAAVDDDFGLRHMLLCRVILGNMEVVQPGEDQSHPSSDEFDSGVDNLLSPRRYIVWSAFMNSHIFPFYLVSYKIPIFNDSVERIPVPTKKRKLVKAANPRTIGAVKVPNSPWMPIPALLSVLSNHLSSSTMDMLIKSHGDFRGKKITRPHMVQKIRFLAGDNLLSSVIKANQYEVPTNFQEFEAITSNQQRQQQQR